MTIIDTGDTDRIDKPADATVDAVEYTGLRTYLAARGVTLTTLDEKLGTEAGARDRKEIASAVIALCNALPKAVVVKPPVDEPGGIGPRLLRALDNFIFGDV